jgi:hypothetical protein
MVRSMLSWTWCHGESLDGVALPAVDSRVGVALLRPVGVGVTGGGDFRRSENILGLPVRRADFNPRSDTPTSASDRGTFLTEGVSSGGLLSVIDSSCLVPGVRSYFVVGVEDLALLSDLFSLGSPNKDWYGSCLISIVGDIRPWCKSVYDSFT